MSHCWCVCQSLCEIKSSTNAVAFFHQAKGTRSVIVCLSEQRIFHTNVHFTQRDGSNPKDHPYWSLVMWSLHIGGASTFFFLVYHLAKTLDCLKQLKPMVFHTKKCKITCPEKWSPVAIQKLNGFPNVLSCPQLPNVSASLRFNLIKESVPGTAICPPVRCSVCWCGCGCCGCLWLLWLWLLSLFVIVVVVVLCCGCCGCCVVAVIAVAAVANAAGKSSKSMSW